MMLAIDIGNTNIAFAVFKGAKILKRFNIPTLDFNFERLKRNLGTLTPEDAVISSVVPSVTRPLVKTVQRLISGSPYILGKDLIVPVKNLTRKPRQVGQDRLVNAYAGIKFYGVPAIIVDFGTAITFDVVSKQGEYLGGMILPGLRISLEALHLKTALLPALKPAKPLELIGRDTKTSMLSGVVNGFSALTEELIKKLKRKIGKHVFVVGTGGDMDLIKKFCPSMLLKVDPDLTLKGINLIYQNKT